MEPPDVYYDYSGSSDYNQDNDVTEYYGEIRFEEYTEAQFDKMWPTVHEMCRSLVHNHCDWYQDSYTLQHTPSKTSYWTGSGDGPVVETYTGGRSARVFSDTQGELIRKALAARKMAAATADQLLVMKSLGTAPGQVKPEPGFWCNLWVSIKFLPTLARFCMQR